MIEILSNSALSTVQDLGREGGMRWGVGTSGAMDPLALAVGNLLLGNEESAAGIEVPVFPFRARFVEDCAFAITGADCAATLDGRPLMAWGSYEARGGQVLTLGLPQPAAWRAARAYVCLAGGVDVPPVLGSRSTQLRGAFGGLDGRALRKGDTLRAGAPGRAARRTGIGVVPPALQLPLDAGGCPAVRVLPAAEYECYTPASRDAFWRTEWKVTPQSDRYGYRLAGEAALQPVAALEMRSHGIVPGVIQVPPGGQPIVQMRDAQPSGGYPKIGTVIEADLWRLGQSPIGSRVRFIETTWDEAVSALDGLRAWLDETRSLLDLCHDIRRAA
jgi:biotin-dependent carboxylase-like uncharacterized protein